MNLTNQHLDRAEWAYQVLCAHIGYSPEEFDTDEDPSHPDEDCCRALDAVRLVLDDAQSHRTVEAMLGNGISSPRT